MKRIWQRSICCLIAFVLTVGLFSVAATATDISDPDVIAVIEQLEAIDTLQQMQAKRGNHKVNSRYMATTTNETIISQHEAARVEYETYVTTMFAARRAAQEAYDSLTPAQKAQIDPSLVAKLNNTLNTTFQTPTCTVTPRTDAFSLEAVAGPAGGLCYEASHHLTLAPEIPSTFILVDTADGKTSWTANGMYVPGVSNYEVTYCCDLDTGLTYGHHYKRVNLEDSEYFDEACAEKVRAIVLNSYPYISMEQMCANLKAGGLSAEFVDSLNRADVIAAVQMAIWSYANADSSEIALNTRYGATYDVAINKKSYMNPLHDYTNELWDWWTTSSKQYSYDARAEYRVNMLLYYLSRLDGIPANQDNTAISSVEITRAELSPKGDGSYDLSMYVHLNNGGTENDDLVVTVTSSHTNEDGSVTQTGLTGKKVNGATKLPITVKANSGDTIRVVVEGTQELGRDVYFYQPEGGRGTSQSLVGMGAGKTYVHAENEFTFKEEMGEMGIRIYKSDKKTGYPINDITFDIYKVEPEEGEALNPTPTLTELAKYQIEENKILSLVTDETGYAAATLEKGLYLVVEREHPKIKEPVSPFYLHIPSLVEKEDEEGNITYETVKVVSVYPKNEPIVPPPPPPPPPPPTDFYGKFQIIKTDSKDSSIRLKGAQFTLYRPATAEDTDVEMVTCNGVVCAVVPVIINGEKLVLTTDGNGLAISPDLKCQTYILVETKAPNGYHLLEEAVTVTVVPDTITAVTTVEIPNEAGTLLPETGGIGTTVFTVFGSILILLAVCMLVLKKRCADMV